MAGMDLAFREGTRSSMERWTRHPPGPAGIPTMGWAENMTRPVPPWSQVGAEEIRALDRNTMPDLLRRLLYAEAESSSIPLDRIRVGYNVDAPDGGIDAEIEWDGGPERTEFIPGRRVGYQVKTSSMTPGKAKGEVLDQERGLKPAIQRILRERGHYSPGVQPPDDPGSDRGDGGQAQGRRYGGQGSPRTTIGSTCSTGIR